MSQKPVVLSVAPYPILPADSGGRLAITGLQDAIGKLCECHVLSTANNGSASAYSFHLHRELNAQPIRYLPRYSVAAIGAAARKVKATHFICEHPYLAPAVHRVSWEWGVPWYMRAHNIERERFRQLGKLWWPAMGIFEARMMRQAKGVFFLTPEDCSWAVKHYRLKAESAHVAPFGINLESAPHDKARARQWIAAEHGLDPNPAWLYFIGALGYAPNADAVRHIIREVLPRLHKAGSNFQILIGGKGLPEEIFTELEAAGPRIRYLGFIDNLDYLLKACDVMLNPVLSGGGIKTKAVEALGYDKMVVSTTSGAAGILREVCGPNLLIAGDDDWDAFTQLTLEAINTAPAIPAIFFAHYSWNKIAARVLSAMHIPC